MTGLSHGAEAEWPTLRATWRTALADVAERRVAAVWLAHEGEFGRLGLKPWYALTTGLRPDQLHQLWLHGLVRLDRAAGMPHLAASSHMIVGRVRLTPLGRRVLAHDTTEAAA